MPIKLQASISCHISDYTADQPGGKVMDIQIAGQVIRIVNRMRSFQNKLPNMVGMFHKHQYRVTFSLDIDQASSSIDFISHVSDTTFSM
jgi:hypothetical protein